MRTRQAKVSGAGNMIAVGGTPIREDMMAIKHITDRPDTTWAHLTTAIDGSRPVYACTASFSEASSFVAPNYIRRLRRTNDFRNGPILYYLSRTSDVDACRL